jgi:3-oxoacyl-[acyl-carrier protein] reductase
VSLNRELTDASRSAVVTGGSSGIGSAVVAELHTAGFDVLSISRSRRGAVSTNAGAQGPKVSHLLQDLLADGATEAVSCAVTRMFPDGLDVLVHNFGGVSNRGSIHSLEERDWEDALRRNLLVPLALTLSLLPLLKTGRDPRVIFVGSTTAIDPGFLDPHYSASKAAALNLAKHLSGRLAHEGITCNTVLAGPILTEGLLEGLRSDLVDGEARTQEEHLASLTEAVPLGRLGDPADVARAVSFLASQQVGWMTGSVIQVDGGKSRRIH